jgi:hypothetical protein
MTICYLFVFFYFFSNFFYLSIRNIAICYLLTICNLLIFLFVHNKPAGSGGSLFFISCVYDSYSYVYLVSTSPNLNDSTKYSAWAMRSMRSFYKTSLEHSTDMKVAQKTIHIYKQYSP